MTQVMTPCLKSAVHSRNPHVSFYTSKSRELKHSLENDDHLVGNNKRTRISRAADDDVLIKNKDKSPRRQSRPSVDLGQNRASRMVLMGREQHQSYSSHHSHGVPWKLDKRKDLKTYSKAPTKTALPNAFNPEIDRLRSSGLKEGSKCLFNLNEELKKANDKNGGFRAANNKIQNSTKENKSPASLREPASKKLKVVVTFTPGMTCDSEEESSRNHAKSPINKPKQSPTQPRQSPITTLSRHEPKNGRQSSKSPTSNSAATPKKPGGYRPSLDNDKKGNTVRSGASAFYSESPLLVLRPANGSAEGEAKNHPRKSPIRNGSPTNGGNRNPNVSPERQTSPGGNHVRSSVSPTTQNKSPKEKESASNERKETEANSNIVDSTGQEDVDLSQFIDENFNPANLVNLPPFGLSNLGNTCYMNSFLQAIFALSPTMQGLVQVYRQLQDRSKMKMLPALLGLHNMYRDGQNQKGSSSHSVRTSFLDKYLEAFKELVGKEKMCFESNFQQDTVEFGEVILAKIEDEFTESFKLPGNAALKDMENPVRKCFQIVTDTELVCTNCQTKTTSPPMTLNFLPLTTSSESTSRTDESNDSQDNASSSSPVPTRNLEEEINKYFAYIDQDEIEGKCEKCDNNRKKQKIVDQKLPNNLFIQLLRFEVVMNDGRVTSTKNHTPVEPSEFISVLERTKNNCLATDSNQNEITTNEMTSRKYQLRAIISHCGSNSVNKGHYVCYVNNPNNGEWYKCDDEAVYERDLGQLLKSERVTENAYSYFYSLCPPQ